jgi:hypothetical protein
MKTRLLALALATALLAASCAAPNSRAFHNRTNKMMSLERTR